VSGPEFGPPRPNGDEVVRLAARAYERDRYLTALLAPAEHRAALLAIAAFAGEVGRIPATVSEPLLGAIRLQWWRDTVEAFPAGLRSGHPVGDALGAAQRRYGLPVGLLHGIIDGQEMGLGADPPTDEAALRVHFAKTEGALFELAARVLSGGEPALAVREGLIAAGRACGLARLLVELPALTAERRTLVPATTLKAVGLGADALYAGPPTAALDGIVDAITTLARQELMVARVGLASASRAMRSAALPVALVEPYLALFQGAGRDRLGAVTDLVPLTRVVRLWWASATGRL